MAELRGGADCPASIAVPKAADTFEAETDEVLAFSCGPLGVRSGACQQLGNGRFHGHVLESRFVDVVISRIAWRPGLAFRARAGVGEVLLGYSLSPDSRVYLDGNLLRTADVTAHIDGQEFDFRALSPGAHVFASFSLESARDGIEEFASAPLDIIGSRQLSIPSWRYAHDARTAIDGILRPIHGGPPCSPDAALCRGEILRLLLSHARLGDPRPPISGSYRTALQINRLMMRSLADPPAIADLAKAERVPDRTLHHAFKKHFGVSPRRHLLAARLNAARSDLLAGDDVANVTETATKWGFHHLGRFSSYFATMFGEPPSATFARRGRRNRRGPIDCPPPPEEALDRGSVRMSHVSPR